MHIHKLQIKHKVGQRDLKRSLWKNTVEKNSHHINADINIFILHQNNML